MKAPLYPVLNRILLPAAAVLVAAAARLHAAPVPDYTVEILSDTYGEAWDGLKDELITHININNTGNIAGTEWRPGDNLISPFYLLDGKAGPVDHVLPGDWRSGFQDINNRNQILATSIFKGKDGSYGPDYYGVLISNGVVTDIGSLGSAYLYVDAHALNDAGQAVGSAAVGIPFQEDGVQRAFLWEQGSGMRDLGTLEGGIGDYSGAWGINESGTVVGSSYSSEAKGPVPVLWKANSTTGQYQIEAFSQFAGKTGSANDITDDGSIVVGEAGNRAFILKNNVLIPNVGDKIYNFPPEQGGGSTDITLSSRAFNVNEKGIVLGSTDWSFDGTTYRNLWVWTEESGTVFLENLPGIGSGYEFGVGLFMNSWDLNDNGWLVGLGNYNGKPVTVLLRPVPEPALPSLLALATALPLLSRRRQPAA